MVLSRPVGGGSKSTSENSRRWHPEVGRKVGKSRKLPKIEGTGDIWKKLEKNFLGWQKDAGAWHCTNKGI